MGLPEFTPVKKYKFLPGDPEMDNGDPGAKSLILGGGFIGGPAESIFGGVTCGGPGRRGYNTPM